MLFASARISNNQLIKTWATNNNPPKPIKNIQIQFEILNILVLKIELTNRINIGNIIEINDIGNKKLANSKEILHKINLECPLSWYIIIFFFSLVSFKKDSTHQSQRFSLTMRLFVMNYVLKHSPSQELKDYVTKLKEAITLGN